MWPRKCKMEQTGHRGREGGGGAEGPEVGGPGPSGCEVRASWKGRLGGSRRAGQRSEPGGSKNPDAERALRTAGLQAGLGRGRAGGAWAWALRSHAVGRGSRSPRSGRGPLPPATFSPRQRGEPPGGDHAGLAAAHRAGGPVPGRTACPLERCAPGWAVSEGGCCPGPAPPELLYEPRPLAERPVGNDNPPSWQQASAGKALCAGPATGLADRPGIKTHCPVQLRKADGAAARVGTGASGSPE